MTENRCIEVLKKMKHMFTETCAKIDENIALDMAVEALEEIQQYRAIGTLSEIRSVVKCYFPESERLATYERIGTIEELKALKEKNESKKPTPIDY